MEFVMVGYRGGEGGQSYTQLVAAQHIGMLDNNSNSVSKCLCTC